MEAVAKIAYKMRWGMGSDRYMDNDRASTTNGVYHFREAISQSKPNANAISYRKQQQNPSWRDEVFAYKGKKCAVCGKTEGLEIHHVKPLANGGTNDFNNLLVVCREHHDQLHMKYSKRKPYKAGRNKIASYENAIPALEMYFNDKIGNAELHRMLGYSATNHSSVPNYKKKYREQYGIPKGYRNCIDLRNVRC